MSGSRSTPDVIVVGAGPAGAATAWALARAGARVLVLDRARFPRPKPCAECLSVETTRLLARMGVLERIEAAGAARLRGMMVRAPGGERIVGTFAGAHGFTPFSERSVAVRREVLDAILLDAAQEAGASVRHLARVSEVERDAHGRVTGVRAEGIHSDHTMHAPLVIGADGLRSVVARRLRLAARARWPRRVAVVSHYEGVAGLTDYGEMHVERDGFVGIADVGGGITTVAMVVPARRARDMGGDPASFLAGWIDAHPHLARRFRQARRVGAVTATGPFAVRTRRAWVPGAALVGDAADFFDPFTGEGIHAAMRGGEILATHAMRALGASTERGADEALAGYDAARRAEFAAKWAIERIIGAVVARPLLMNRAARTLARRPDMADLLVGVTGHLVPPGAVLRPSYVAGVFVHPALFRRTTASSARGSRAGPSTPSAGEHDDAPSTLPSRSSVAPPAPPPSLP